MRDLFFLNIDFGKKLTGIERSSLKRALLFVNYLNYTPKFITAKLNIELKNNVDYYKKIGWMPENCEVINVYDDLRERFESKEKKIGARFFEYFGEEFDITDKTESHQHYRSKENGFSMYVVWSDFTKTKVNYINFFHNGKKIRREKYDGNGILFLIELLDESSKVYQDSIIGVGGSVILKRFYNDKGLMRIEKYDNNKLMSIFNTEQDLIEHWLKEFNPGAGSLLIIDKNKIWSQAASALSKTCKVVSVLHSTHIREADIENVKDGRINSNYLNIINGKHPVDAIITLTKMQKDDIIIRCGDKHNLTVIPHSLDIVPVKNDLNSKEDFFNIVMICRLAPEKQIDDAVYIIKELKKLKKNVRLYIYGEGSERKGLEKIINDLKLQDSIFLPGFTDNIKDVFSRASLSLLTSKCEGFSLAILESLGYGVPVFSYDIKYGPSSMIDNGFNGFLFEPKKIELIAETINSFLNDNEKMKIMRKNAYETALCYTEENVAKKWEKFILELYCEK